MSVLSENAPQDPISPFPIDHQELDSHATQNSTEILQPSEVPSEKSHSRWEHPSLRWANSRNKHWRYILPLLTLTLLGILIVLIFLYTHAKRIFTSPNLIITTTTQSLALPSPDSALTATPLIYSIFLSSPSSNPSTLLAYTTSNGSICSRTYLSTWLTPVQCITNLSPKPHTPLALLDWYGGPSIYYITTSNHIHGINNVPQNDTWTLSSINTQSPPVSIHAESQLTAVTWLNGSSAWLYYQDQNSQLREYGIDDYRDTSWRDGALGPLGIALQGTGIGASRYLFNGSEVLEVFIQTDNDAIHGRVFMDDVWEANFYSVDYTDSGLPPKAALTATTIEADTGRGEGAEERVMLVWVNSSGFVNVQGRGTVNVSAYNSFSGPKGIVEGDGGVQPGLAATGWGVPRVWFGDGVKILDLEDTGGGSEVGGNWTSVDVTSL
jgi:hypothetical protein